LLDASEAGRDGLGAAAGAALPAETAAPEGDGAAPFTAAGAVGGELVAAGLAGAGSKPGSDCGSGFIGSETGAKFGTEDAEVVGAGAAGVDVVGAAGAESAGVGVVPAGMLPGSSLPTLAPGTITRGVSLSVRTLLAGADERGFEGASSA
jgi:hypothetical protein